MRIWGQAEPGEVTSGSAAPREKGEEKTNFVKETFSLFF
jgi:hypothetical protein